MSNHEGFRRRHAEKIADGDMSDIADGQTSEDEAQKSDVLQPKPIIIKDVIIRSITASTLAIIFLGLLQTGHFYCILAGVLTQIELFREVINVRYKHAKEKRMPLFRTLQWLWFFLAMFYTYGETLHNFCSENENLIHITKMTQFVHTIVFIGYCGVFMATVLTFRKGIIRYQFSQLMFTIVTVLIIVGQCKFLGTNTLNGIFWFFFPMATVVMNDVSAYFCGISLGRRFIKAQFIAISPKKTWEGFIGAAILTLLFSFFFSGFLARWTWFTCPAHSLYVSPFPSKLECDPLPVFLPTTYKIPWMSGGAQEITLRPIQFHGLAYGLFASLVAPFGGFLASAIKRAYKVKDFDSFIPGHGGLMDRMDCQLLITCFTYLHYNTFILPKTTSVKSLLLSITLLPLEEQIRLLKLLEQHVDKMIKNGSYI